MDATLVDAYPSALFTTLISQQFLQMSDHSAKPWWDQGSFALVSPARHSARSEVCLANASLNLAPNESMKLVKWISRGPSCWCNPYIQCYLWKSLSLDWRTSYLCSADLAIWISSDQIARSDNQIRAKACCAHTQQTTHICLLQRAAVDSYDWNVFQHLSTRTSCMKFLGASRGGSGAGRRRLHAWGKHATAAALRSRLERKCPKFWKEFLPNTREGAISSIPHFLTKARDKKVVIQSALTRVDPLGHKLLLMSGAHWQTFHVKAFGGTVDR